MYVSNKLCGPVMVAIKDKYISNGGRIVDGRHRGARARHASSLATYHTYNMYRYNLLFSRAYVLIVLLCIIFHNTIIIIIILSSMSSSSNRRMNRAAPISNWMAGLAASSRAAAGGGEDEKKRRRRSLCEGAFKMEDR